MRVFRAMGAAGEQPEEVLLEPFGQQGGVRPGLVMHRDRTGQRADVRREPPLGGGDGGGGNFGEAGEFHGETGKPRYVRNWAS